MKHVVFLAQLVSPRNFKSKGSKLNNLESNSVGHRLFRGYS